jgi:hypothetical protein
MISVVNTVRIGSQVNILSASTLLLPPSLISRFGSGIFLTQVRRPELYINFHTFLMPALCLNHDEVLNFNHHKGDNGYTV